MVATLQRTAGALSPLQSQPARMTLPTASAAPMQRQPGQLQAVQPVNPALSALRNTVNPQAQTQPAGPFQSAQVDTSKQDAVATQENTQSAADRNLSIQVGLNAMNGIAQANSSNAARMGLASGGASYLSGQRSAAIAGTNAFNTQLMGWDQQNQNNLQNQAGLDSNAASQNAANQQATGQSNTQYGIDKQKAQDSTQSSYYANQEAAIDARAKNQANIYGKDQKGPMQAQYIATKANYDKAVADGNWDQANTYLNQLNQMVPAKG